MAKIENTELIMLLKPIINILSTRCSNIPSSEKLEIMKAEADFYPEFP